MHSFYETTASLYNHQIQHLTRKACVHFLGGDSQRDNSDRNSMLMNLVMQLLKVCNKPKPFERRVPQSPFQFQVEPPLSQATLRPTVLALNESTATLHIKIIWRSEVVHTMSQKRNEVALHLRDMIKLIRPQFAHWSCSRLMKCLENLPGCILSIAQLSVGYFAS